ncbi:MAG: hypothetical protein ACK470_19825, partial [Pseudanabaena sp.]
DGAGTTTLPSFNADGTIATPAPVTTTSTGAPRYIAPDDWRFPRRPSFLRFDDLYKDGNEQLIFAGSCPGSNATWPMVIGVNNGDAVAGFTYPMIMGGLGAPFTLGNKNSYGTVGCPDSGITVSLFNNVDQPEGRRRDQNAKTPAPGTIGSLETQLGQTTLPPQVTWGTGNDNGATTAPDATGSVTNSNDNTSGEAVTNDRNRSTNNAVYRRYNFNVGIANRALLGSGQSVRVRVTLYNSGGATPGNIDATTGDIVLAARTFPTLVPDSTTGTDYINAFYNPNTALNMATIARTTAGTFPSPVVVPAPTTAAPALNLYPRLPLGASSTAGAATGTIPPENESCLATEYCTVVSWTGPTATTNDPDTKTLTVLVVRDSVSEGVEEFRVKLN